MRVTIDVDSYTVRRDRTVIPRVLERNDAPEVLISDEFIITADNDTSVLRQYVFTGMSWCGEEDSDHPVRAKT